MSKSILLTCPCDAKVNLIKKGKRYQCDNSLCIHSTFENSFPISNGIPVIISEENCDTVCSMVEKKIYVKRTSKKYKIWSKILNSESQTTIKNCSIFVEKVLMKSDTPKVLVIGSGERGSGTKKLWSNKKIEIHGIDVYGSDSVDVICDAHYLPLKSNNYDGVWIQAVLEHVVQPDIVVEEIFRVLKFRGLIYAETPFMQQVHEGAYDFNRFTVLGHRYLFKKFKAIDFGGNKGSEIVLLWSIRYFVWAITRSRNLGRLFGVIFSVILRPLHLFLDKKSLHDSSSGVFFLGRKILDHKLTHKDLVKLYGGKIK